MPALLAIVLHVHVFRVVVLVEGCVLPDAADDSALEEAPRQLAHGTCSKHTLEGRNFSS